MSCGFDEVAEGHGAKACPVPGWDLPSWRAAGRSGSRQPDLAWRFVWEVGGICCVLAAAAKGYEELTSRELLREL